MMCVSIAVGTLQLPQVKDLAAASRAAEEKYRTTIATQAGVISSLHYYIDAISQKHRIDTADRPGVRVHACAPV